MSRLPIPEHKAQAHLTGEDGNAFAVMGRALSAMKAAGYSSELREQYQEEAMAGDYYRMLATTLEYVDDIGEEEYDDDWYVDDSWYDDYDDNDDEDY